MNAYKFRPAQPFERISDILISRRLYCAEVARLNDVQEADIRVGNDRGREAAILDFGLDVARALSRYRVCSLCKSFEHPLLWAHYAAGSSGLAIEVNLPPADVTAVAYDDDFVYLSDHVDAGVESAVRAALARKLTVWEYEQEVRLITHDEFYNLPGPIQRVIAGSRMDQPTLHSLQDVCEALGITLDRAIVADWGIYTVGVQERGSEARRLTSC